MSYFGNVQRKTKSALPTKSSVNFPFIIILLLFYYLYDKLWFSSQIFFLTD